MNKKTAISLSVIFCVQVLFFIAVILFPQSQVEGSAFFRRTPTYEEWEAMIENEYQFLPSSIYGLFQLASVILWVALVICFVFHYRGKNLTRMDFLIPVIGLIVYLPIYFHIRNAAKAYYLWMHLLPLEYVSLLLLFLICFRKFSRNNL